MCLGELPAVVLGRIFELLGSDGDQLRLRVALGRVAEGRDAWVPLALHPVPSVFDIEEMVTGGCVMRDLAVVRLGGV